MDENIRAVTGYLGRTASSLGRSFSNYWPADDKNDPVERNVSLHFSHVLLCEGLSVFAEADHPKGRPILGIDIFGLSPCNTWFLGCEFKRLYSAEKLLSLAADVDRLSSFWPRTEYSTKLYGQQVRESTNACKTDFGSVGHDSAGR